MAAPQAQYDALRRSGIRPDRVAGYWPLVGIRLERAVDFFLLILWMLGGLVWGWAMWRFFDFRSQSQKIDEAHPDNQQDT